MESDQKTLAFERVQKKVTKDIQAVPPGIKTGEVVSIINSILDTFRISPSFESICSGELSRNYGSSGNRGDLPGYVDLVGISYVMEKLDAYMGVESGFEYVDRQKQSFQMLRRNMDNILLSFEDGFSKHYFMARLISSKLGNQQENRKYASVLKEKHLIPFSERYGVDNVGVIAFVMGNCVPRSDLDVIAGNVRHISFVDIPLDYNSLRRGYESWRRDNKSKILDRQYLR